MKLFTICFLGFVFIDSSSCKVQKDINATELDGSKIVQSAVKNMKPVKTTAITTLTPSQQKSLAQKQKEEEEQKRIEKEKLQIQKRIENREKVKSQLLDILQKLDSI